MARITVTNLAASYTGRSECILNIPSLVIDNGEILALYGRNHAGKSTLLKILSGSLDGIRTGEDATILYDRRSIDALGRKRISYLPQNFSDTLFPWLSLKDNLTLRLLAQRTPTESRLMHADALSKSLGFSSTDRLFEFFGLHDKAGNAKRANDLSGGQKQLLALLRSFIPAPSILLLDEPFSAIDLYNGPEIRQKLLTIIQQESMTTVLISHRLDRAVEVADRVVMLGPTDSGSVITNEYRIRDPRSREKVSQEKYNHLLTQIRSENAISQ